LLTSAEIADRRAGLRLSLISPRSHPHYFVEGAHGPSNGWWRWRLVLDQIAGGRDRFVWRKKIIS
jgi:hypothetical protein